jgi:hypothetical protein
LEAMAAAPGLASAKVMMVTADAKEKQGMVDAKVKIAEAEAVSKYGVAEADALRAKMDAEAEGKEKLGMADVHVRTADADATVKAGQANALVIEARFQAEAKGLREKFDAMKGMSKDTREHEEFRMRMERAHTETMAGIEAQTGIAKEQAEVLGSALSHAKIDIVGGQGDYFDSFVRALSIGKGIDGAIAKSDTLKIGLKDHLSGERDMVGDVRDIIGALGGSASELSNLSAAALMTKVAREGNDSQKAALQKLIESFRN